MVATLPDGSTVIEADEGMRIHLTALDGTVTTAALEEGGSGSMKVTYEDGSTVKTLEGIGGTLASTVSTNADGDVMTVSGDGNTITMGDESSKTTININRKSDSHDILVTSQMRNYMMDWTQTTTVDSVQGPDGGAIAMLPNGVKIVESVDGKVVTVTDTSRGGTTIVTQEDDENGSTEMRPLDGSSTTTTTKNNVVSLTETTIAGKSTTISADAKKYTVVEGDATTIIKLHQHIFADTVLNNEALKANTTAVTRSQIRAELATATAEMAIASTAPPDTPVVVPPETDQELNIGLIGLAAGLLSFLLCLLRRQAAVDKVASSHAKSAPQSPSTFWWGSPSTQETCQDSRDPLATPATPTTPNTPATPATPITQVRRNLNAAKQVVTERPAERPATRRPQKRSPAFSWKQNSRIEVPSKWMPYALMWTNNPAPPPKGGDLPLVPSYQASPTTQCTGGQTMSI
jgi:hypothetical protein